MQSGFNWGLQACKINATNSGRVSLMLLGLRVLGKRGLQTQQAFISTMAPKRAAPEAGTAAENKRSKTKRGSVNSTKDGPQKTNHPTSQYYLMKSEVDVFSIDDLESRQHSTEPWDGVRNHQAKKVIQSMTIGDQAFFWASNTKQPGIVGIVQIVRDAYPDPTQFDPSHKYYDASATKESPKWYCVDVKLVRKLQTPITLQHLKEYKEGELSEMALFKYSRLSVQHVRPEEWQFVTSLEEEH